jgi:hypothetical protein
MIRNGTARLARKQRSMEQVFASLAKKLVQLSVNWQN